jgi:hypothetical protein
LRKVIATVADAAVSLTSAILYIRQQQVMSSVALAIEELRARGNDIKLLVPQTNTNHVHTPTLDSPMVKFLQNSL